MESNSPTDAVILEGILSESEGIPAVLEKIAGQKIAYGVLQVDADDTRWLVFIRNGSEITGAVSVPDKGSGVHALQQVFALTSGRYSLRAASGEPAGADQALQLSIQRLFQHMRQAIKKSNGQESLTDSVRASEEPLSPRDIWTTQNLRRMQAQQVSQLAETMTLKAPELPLPSETPPVDEWKPYLFIVSPLLALILCVVVLIQTNIAYSTHVRFNAGIDDLKRGMPDLAIEQFSSCLSTDPTLASAYLYRAIAYSKQGDSEKAIVDYTEVLQRQPGNSEALLGRACQYLKSRDYDKVRRDCDAVLKSHPDLADAYRMRAIASAKNNDYAAAAADCAAYLQRAGNEAKKFEKADIYAILAAARLKSDEFGAAIDDYSKAIALDDHSMGLFMGRAAAFKVAGDWKNALADASTAIKLGAGWDAYKLRGQCYQALGNLSNALADTNKALKLAPDDPKLYKQRGDIHLQSHSLAAAEADYRSSLELFPNDPEVRKRVDYIAQTQAGKGTQLLLADVLPTNDSHAAVAPRHEYTGDSATLTRTGYGLLKSGEVSEAIAALTAALKADSNNHQARLYLAHAFISSGSSGAAAEQFRLIEAVQPLSSEDRLAYAHALEASGQRNKAIGIYEKLLAADGMKKDVRLALIGLYVQAGMPQKAERAAADGMARSTDPADRKMFEVKLKDLTAPKPNGQSTDNQT